MMKLQLRQSARKQLIKVGGERFHQGLWSSQPPSAADPGGAEGAGAGGGAPPSPLTFSIMLVTLLSD